jgi:hypothetical protein
MLRRVNGVLRPVAGNLLTEFPPVDAERHALLARRLIEACGGLLEAAASCRLEKSQLSRFTDPEAGQFMPADVMVALERKAGGPIYSLAIAELQASRGSVEDLVTGAC